MAKQDIAYAGGEFAEEFSVWEAESSSCFDACAFQTRFGNFDRCKADVTQMLFDQLLKCNDLSCHAGSNPASRTRFIILQRDK